MIAWLRRQFITVKEGTGLRAELLRGAMGVGGLRFLSLPLGIAASILLARGLGPQGFGQYAFVMAAVSVLSLPIGPGMQLIVTRQVAAYQQEQDLGLLRGLLRRAHQGVVLGFFILALVLVPLGALQATASWSDGWTLLLVGLLILPFLGLNAVRTGALRGLGNVVLAQLPDLLARPGLHLLFVVVLLGCGLLNTASALLSQATAAGFAFLIGAWFLYRFRPSGVTDHAPKYRSAEWSRAWMALTLLTAAVVLNSQIGILFLGWMGTDAEVAALRVAERGAQLVAFSLAIVTMVIGPHITRAYRSGNCQRLQALSRQSARGALVVALPVALPLIFFGGPIISYVFGADYVDLAILPLAILAAAQLVNVAFALTGYFLVMSGHERDTLVGLVIGLSLNVLACFILIPDYGTAGAACAAAVGLIVRNMVIAFTFVKRLRLRPGIL